MRALAPRIIRNPVVNRALAPRHSAIPTHPLKVLVANMAGACGGVQQAIIRAFKAQAPILGDVVHNPGVVARLTELGSPQIDRHTTVADLTVRGVKAVVITAHGDPVDRKAELQAAGIQIIDTTCPRIKVDVYQNIVKYEASGHKVVLIGDPKHVEVIASRTHGKDISVVYSQADVDALDLPPGKPVVALCQTTITEQKFLALCALIRAQKCPDLKVHDTRCKPVADTQAGVESLAPTVQSMVIMGGKKSSNTAKLLEIAARHTRAFQIEEPGEIVAHLDDLSLLDRFGIGAGTSTPLEDITALVATLTDGLRIRFSRGLEHEQIGRLPSESDIMAGIMEGSV